MAPVAIGTRFLAPALALALLVSGCGAGASSPAATAISTPVQTPAPSPTPTSPPATPTIVEEAPAAATATSTPGIELAPNPSTTSTLLLDSIRAMSMVASYEYTATTASLEFGNSLQARSEGVFQAPDRLQWTSRAGTIRSQAVISGSQYFVSFSPGKWTRAGGVSRARDGQLLWTLAAYGEEVEIVGQRHEDGDPLLHISFKVPVERLTFENRPWQLASCDLWLSRSSHRVLALKLFAQEPNYETTQRFFFFNYDAPVTITLPEE